MKTLLLLFTTLFIGKIGLAQSMFERYYVGVGTSTLALNEQTSGNLFAGIANESGVSIIDMQGDLIYTRCYDRIPFTILQSVRRYSNNVIYLSGGYISDSCSANGSFLIPHVDPVIGKMDSVGEILSVNRYRLNTANCINGAWDLNVLADGGAIAWGRPESFFALRVDFNGTPLWSKQFPYQGSFRFIQELPGGDFLAGFNMDGAGAAVARLDADGNFIWCKSYVRPNGFVMRCVIESDSSFAIMGFTDHMTGQTPPPDYHPKMFMMKLNGAGEVQWCRGYSHPTDQWDGSLAVDKLQDGNYAVLSTLAGRPLLMKTDPSGDTLWTRSAGVNGISYSIVNLLAGSDGGIYYDGAAYGNWGDGSGGVFLFKTDSLGHLPCSEAVPPPITITELFPVDSSFTLTYSEGATAYPISVADTTYPPVTTYDGCTITSVQDPMLSDHAKPSVHPNPNTGRFTVEFTDPLTVDSFYSVYDAVGRLLFQRPLAKGQVSEEIDLSRFGKGTYLVRVTSREGVCYERVVVQ